MQEKELILTPEEDIIAILKSFLSNDDKRERIEVYHDYEIVKALLLMDNSLRKTLYEVLPLHLLSEVFAELDPEDAYEILENTSINVITSIFSEMETDDLVDIIDVIEEPDDRITYLSLVNVEKRITIKTLLNFDDSLVGSIMNNSFIALDKDMNVKAAINQVVSEAPECEFINNIYVTDDDNILIGALSLKELISAGIDQSQKVEDIMSQNLIYVTPATENEDAIEMMKNYDFQLLPVVSKSGKLLGIISFDDMMEALNYELDSDYSSLAGLTEAAFDGDESVLRTVKKRLPWLIILLFVNIITSSIIASYESVLIALPMLAVFMPLISSMAGNSGTQSLGVIIRLFATNQLDKKKAVWKHLANQLFTGIVLGISIAILMFVLVIIINTVKGQDLQTGLKFAGVVALSMNIALVVATIEGAVVPLFIKLIKLDPAVASGPFITTMSDIISILIYFGLASLIIRTLL